MRSALIAIAVITLAWPVSAAAEPPRAWTIGVRPAYVFMGSKRPTGGLMPRFEVLRSWTTGSGVSVALGAGFGAFGFGEPDALRWLGILGGPIVGVSGRPWAAPIEARAALHIDAGRVPTCNAWGLCILYSGFYPAAEVTLAWAPSNSASVGASLVTRRVSTIGWSGFNVEPSITGRWSF